MAFQRSKPVMGMYTWSICLRSASVGASNGLYCSRRYWVPVAISVNSMLMARDESAGLLEITAGWDSTNLSSSSRKRSMLSTAGSQLSGFSATSSARILALNSFPNNGNSIPMVSPSDHFSVRGSGIKPPRVTFKTSTAAPSGVPDSACTMWQIFQAYSARSCSLWRVSASSITRNLGSVPE